MLTYNTTLQNKPPAASPLRDMAAFAVAPPHSQFGSNYLDLAQSYGQRNAADYAVAADKANTDYQLKQQEAQRQLVLQGLQQMSQAQQNEQGLANQRLGNATGLMSSLLSGLF
jgi:hypothetical protein